MKFLALMLLAAFPLADAASTEPQLSKTETRMVDAINKYRAERKLPALTPDPILMKVARNRAPVYSHVINGKWSWDTAREMGFKGSVTDNIGQSQGGDISPEEMVIDGWGDERPGHTVGHDMQMKGYRKINGKWIDQKFNRVGVAHVGRNWIMVVGRFDPPVEKKTNSGS